MIWGSLSEPLMSHGQETVSWGWPYEQGNDIQGRVSFCPVPALCTLRNCRGSTLPLEGGPPPADPSGDFGEQSIIFSHSGS